MSTTQQRVLQSTREQIKILIYPSQFYIPANPKPSNSPNQTSEEVFYQKFSLATTKHIA